MEEKKMSRKKVEQPEGNYFDKYNSSNVIIKKMMEGFFNAYNELINEVILQKESKAIKSVLEAGCGEGEVTNYLYKKIKGAKIEAFDVSTKVIEIAKELSKDCEIHFEVGSIYDIRVKEKYELVVCSEVLEHLENPEKALEQLRDATKEYIICSVPREPIWRILNMMRGKYWRHLGNTPGHINHWSKRKFLSFLKKNGCKIVDVKTPLPWTVVLVKI